MLSLTARMTAVLLGLTLPPLSVSAQPKAATQRGVVQQRMQIQAALQDGGKSDIDPFSKVNASVTLIDDGTTLTIAGSGSGFDRNLAFVSLLYADPSARRGALACLPPTPNPYTPQQMFAAYWLPVGSTHRTLFVQKTGANYVSLASIGTMSVRFDSTPGVDPTVNQNPGRYFLQACGRV